MNKKEKNKPFFLRVIKKIKVSHLILLALLLIGNTYAWFIYIDTVSNSIDVHIKAWNIDLQDDQGTVTDTVTVYVDAVYPGMTTFEKDINVSNYSDVDATVSYDILEATIMDETFVTREGRAEFNQPIQGNEFTSAQLEAKLENDYPFYIDFLIDNAQLEAVTGTATYTIQIGWDYESGNDTLDTYWGERAYQYIQDNPGVPCISLNVKIKIQQNA